MEKKKREKEVGNLENSEKESRKDGKKLEGKDIDRGEGGNKREKYSKLL